MEVVKYVDVETPDYDLDRLVLVGHNRRRAAGEQRRCAGGG